MVCCWENKEGSKDLKRMKQTCPLTCALSSLLLQGATFHSGVLQESSPEASELTTASEVWIGFVPVDCEEIYDNQYSVVVPLYLSVSREEYLTELKMPLKEGDHGKWVLSGVSLFLNEDD
jgi:hypothetical protein